jgi:hypothetical protein
MYDSAGHTKERALVLETWAVLSCLPSCTGSVIQGMLCSRTCGSVS